VVYRIYSEDILYGYYGAGLEFRKFHWESTLHCDGTMEQSQKAHKIWKDEEYIINGLQLSRWSFHFNLHHQVV